MNGHVHVTNSENECEIYSLKLGFGFCFAKIQVRAYYCTKPDLMIIGHILRKRRMGVFAVCDEIRTRR